MKYLSEILLNALNSGACDSSRDSVQRLIERWELVCLDLGTYSGRWVHNSEAAYIERFRRSGFASADDCFCCEHCSGMDLNSCSYSRNYLSLRGAQNEEIICTSCNSEDTYTCEDCGEAWRAEHISEHNGDYLCPNCYSEAEQREEDDEDDDEYGIPSYHSKSRPTSPFSLYSERVYSAELELESENPSQLANSLKNSNIPRVLWERDGSLDSRKGVEVILSYYKIPELSEHLKTVASLALKAKSLSWGTNKCGLHLNSNRGSLWNKLKTMRLLWLVKRHSQALISISGRNNYYASWDRLPPVKEWAKGYCEKYTCIRVGSDRFEWRMFRGTLNSARLNAYLETVQLFEDFALENTSHQLLKREGEFKEKLKAIIANANANGATIR